MEDYKYIYLSQTYNISSLMTVLFSKTDFQPAILNVFHKVVFKLFSMFKWWTFFRRKEQRPKLRWLAVLRMF
jgi:hypothetical protein